MRRVYRGETQNSRCMGNFWILLLFSITSIYSLDRSKEIIDGLNSRDQSQIIESIRSIKESNLHHSLPLLSEVIRSDSSSDDILLETINLYESYGESLTDYYKNAHDDYEWIMNNLQNEDLICEIIKVFHKRKDRKFIYSILNLITHRSSRVRMTANYYLHSFKDDRILPFVLELGNSENALEKYYYLETLSYIDDERAYLHIHKLINDNSPTIRYYSISILDQFQIKDTENLILAHTKNDTNYEVRKIAITYAKNRSLKKKVNIFKDGLEDTNREVREISLDSIYSFKDPSYARYVSKFMEVENDPILKLKAIETLMVLNNDGGGVGLTSLLQFDKNKDVRKKSAQAIGLISVQKSSSDVLNKSLQQEDNIEVKLEIINSIGIKKDKSSVPFLIEKLNNNSETVKVKIESINALYNISDTTYLPELLDIMEEQKEIKDDLRKFIKAMLNKINKRK